MYKTLFAGLITLISISSIAKADCSSECTAHMINVLPTVVDEALKGLNVSEEQTKQIRIRIGQPDNIKTLCETFCAGR